MNPTGTGLLFACVWIFPQVPDDPKSGLSWVCSDGEISTRLVMTWLVTMYDERLHKLGSQKFAQMESYVLDW
jgi:hypothetical protein